MNDAQVEARGPEADGDRPWHALEIDAVLEAMESSRDGLSTARARRLLGQHGPNRLTPPARRGILRRLLAQFQNVLIHVLIGAGLLTLALGHWIDASVIFGVVVINAVIGFIQEGKAERALDAIRGMLAPAATVKRDGRRLSVDAAELVPGDLVLLESGDRVPADLRLIDVRGLRVDEAALTGESEAVDKSSASVQREAALGDRVGMVYSGTLVAAGRASGVVVATGDATEIGHISSMLADVTVLRTPLVRQFERFGRWLTIGILLLATVTFAFGLLVRDYTATEMFLAAVGLAVAAIPEGLPAIMTITLAIGVQRMARRNAIIRRLPAVETLGSVTIICTDKTGTLTRNEMTVQSVATSRSSCEVTGSGYAPAGEFRLDGARLDPMERPLLAEMIRGAVLCSDATLHDEGDNHWRVNGDPTEGALVTLAMKAGLDPDAENDRRPRTDVIPFESEQRLMASLHHGPDDDGTVFVKGAPERLLEMCAQQADEQGNEPLDVDYWRDRIDEIAARGQRVIALAARPAHPDHRRLELEDLDDGLVFMGLFGLADAPREEAIEAIARCQSAGIVVKMVTGDHVSTAQAIGRHVGISQDAPAMTGQELDALDDRELAECVERTNVFARTSPAQKLRLVEALQARGHVVSMTGDGVNDAPALKRADVGVAMGLKGTEVAREAAEMVLADDNFASIGSAVEEGRIVYDNLKKAIAFILPTNGGEAFTLIAAIVLGLALPITPVQILWINMVTAVTLALALAFEPGERGVMRRPPRKPDEPLLSIYLLWRIAFVSVVLVSGIMGLFVFERHAGADIETARTVAVNALVIFEAFYLLNCRMLHDSAFTRRILEGAGISVGAIGLVLVLQLLMTYTPPMQFLFDTRAIGAGEWARILAAGVVVFGLVEVEKWVVRQFLARRRAVGGANRDRQESAP
jgi:magnesium-transporting ATPase (P-type)